ncbi:MAG: aminodeoxychorismate/anthranilate synthase component II [Atribacterota bacterium]|nr:aminodeoxychorismate/anthranilate synthase component II [Atribacterota bacterium]
MILVIDNYDSFTYNLVQYLSEFGIPVEVFRNNKIEIAEIMQKDLLGIVISPGPGTPDDAGISIELIKIAGPEIPILGVCLGHQAIAVAYGGRVLPSIKLMHGKSSDIHHQQKGIYEGIESPFLAGRYHSLMVDIDSFPDCLEINARTDDNIIMGIQHKEYPVIGVQYHPESILTKMGKILLKNFISFAKEHKKDIIRMKQ